MKRDDLAVQIYKSSHLEGEFLLRSGVTSNEYFDKYRFESTPDVLKNIGKQIVHLLPEKYDYLAGLEMGGIPIAVSISLHIRRPIVFVRKEAKKYGTRQFVEGADIKGKRLVIVEDVVTSGGQVMESVKALRDAGAIIDTVVCVIDRESTGVQNLEKMNLRLNSLFTMSEIKAYADRVK
jgi:orotate phosphoribosyltransferase